MAIKVEVARYVGEVITPEMEQKFKVYDDGNISIVSGITLYKKCPMCGDLTQVRFMDRFEFRNNCKDRVVSPWFKTMTSCQKCKRSFGTAFRVIKEEEE